MAAWRIGICPEVTLHLSLYTTSYPYGLTETSKNAHNMTNIVLHFFFKAHCATSSNMSALMYPLWRHSFVLQGLVSLIKRFPFISKLRTACLFF